MGRYILFSIFLMVLVLKTTGQEQKPEVLLSEAIYQEEVNGELDAAIKTYKSIVDENPDNREISAEALLHLGSCYEKMESPEAYRTYKEVINKYGDQKEEVAIALARVDYLDAYAADINEKAERYISQGNELYKVWEYELAIKEYETALQLNPNSLIAQNAQYYKGQSYFKAGQYDKALATFKDLIEDNPGSTIIPVTELMIAQVEQTKNNNNSIGYNNYPNKNTITDPETGITYTKVRSYAGKNDLISYTTGGFNLSSDGRFMVLENQVVPVDGSPPFKLVDMMAFRSIYSPDMQKAAFYADSAIWIVLVSPETGHAIEKPKKLIDGYYVFQHPVSWSPNGERIAFNRRDQEIINDLWAINVNDGKLVPIASSQDNMGYPTWSPDGEKIAYRKEGEIWLTSANGEESEMIIKNSINPCWSPDSKWLYHSYMESRNLLSLENRINYEFKIPKEVGNFIGFTPDGGEMLFYRSSYDTKWPLKVVSTTGGPSCTPELDGQIYDVQWSANDNIMLVQSENEKEETVFKIIHLTGQKPVNLNIETNIDGDPIPFIASPDLTKMAFWIKRDDELKDLYVASLSLVEAKVVGPLHQVFEGLEGSDSKSDFSWSPDGSKLAIMHENDIWIVSIEGSNPIQITDNPDDENWLEWSPDGSMISYYVTSKHEKLLYVVPVSGGKSKLVHKLQRRDPGGGWSPDSKSMAIITDNELQIISLNGSKIRSIDNLGGLGIHLTTTPRFSPDGKYLTFIGTFQDDRTIIYMYSIHNSELLQLDFENSDDFKYSLHWSHDGKWLAYLAFEEFKVRPEGTMWEADFAEVLEKLRK